MRKKDLEVTLKSDRTNPDEGCVVVTDIESGVVIMAVSDGNHDLYEMILSSETGSKLTKKNMMEVEQPGWHARFFHTSAEAIRKTAILVSGLEDASGKLSGDFYSCVENKSVIVSRKPTDRMARNNWEPLELFHSDLCFPIGTQSVGKAR